MSKTIKKKVQNTNDGVWYAVAAVRILLGVTFLWAFFDKLFGLGFSTPIAKAWINGGSPTAGFLGNVTGPFSDVFNAMAGVVWIDWLFMIGLLAVGVGLVFGVAVRLSAVAGSVMLILMWMASLPIKTNPFIDDHIVYIAALLVISYGLNSQRWSLSSQWSKLSFVKSNDWLQ